MQVSIEKIKVSDRIRKDFGDIEELANDIKENGLINPPVVTPELELIAGERRLRAMKSLGYDQIEVRVMTVQDALHQLKLEISENENRKDFTFSEKMKWAEQLKVEYEKIARANTTANLPNSPSVRNLTLGRVDEKIADEVGLGSRDTFRRAEYIYQNADEEQIKAIDENKTSINAVYQELKKEVEQKEKKILELQNELETRPVVKKVKEVEVEKVVEKVDNDLVRKLKSELENEKRERMSKEKDIELLEKKRDILEKRAKIFEADAEKYNEYKKQFEYLKTSKDDLSRTIGSVTSISSLVVEIENLLQTKLAPVKYSRAVQEQIHDEIVINNILEMVGRVSGWCNEMYSLIKDGKGYYIVEDYALKNSTDNEENEFLKLKGDVE